eukprot:scaffold9878_cov45-Attheya_sp.AAC.4
MHEVETQPQAKRARHVASHTSILELNVGGQTFSTTRDTLLAYPTSPYFKRLLNQHVDGDDDYQITGALLDAQGRIFIDRNPKLFEQVLEYLRSNFDAEQLTKQEKEKLKKEALYYQLDGLIDLLRPPSTGYDERALSPDDQNLRQEANEIRAMLLAKSISAADADNILVDFFPPLNPPLEELFEKPITSPEATILFHEQVEEARIKPRLLPSSAQDFKERLVRFGGPFMANFPMENVVIAGGSVLQCLLRDHATIDEQNSSDIDVFVVADSDEKAKATFDRILQHLSRRDGSGVDHNEMLVSRSAFAVTFCVGKPQRHIQLILIRYQCAADVVLNFDIDCSQVLWDGQRVLATPSAIRALGTGINFADPERRGASNEYQWRLAKYSRRGFLVAVPGLDVTRVKEEYTRNSCFGYHNGLLKRIHLSFTEGEDHPKHHPDSAAIVGLAQLIVFSTLCEKWLVFDRAVRHENEEPNRRVYDDNAIPGGHLGPRMSLGTGNYMLDYNRVEVGLTDWKLPTPPYAPPIALGSKLSYARSIDTGGIEILPWTVEPTIVFGLLNGRNVGITGDMKWYASRPVSLRDRRVICFDLIRDVTDSTTCANVLDAKSQYPSHPFVKGRGLLSRYLEFHSSTDVNTNPWISSNDADWMKGIYN